MNPRVVFLFLFSACATAPSSANGTEPSASPRRCLSKEAADAEKARLNRWNEEQLRATLSQKGLEIVSLAQGPTRYAHGDKLPPNLVPAVVAPWTPFTDAEGRTIVAEGEATYNLCGVNEPLALRFVRDATKRIYLLALNEEVVSTRTLRICACGGFNMPGCGAPGVYTRQRTWVLPQGTTWGGTQPITWRLVGINEQWQRPADCVPPTPMP